MSSISTKSTNPEKNLWFFAVSQLWDSDKTYVLIFIVANIIAGQVGLITSLILTWQSGGEFMNAWRTAANSGIFYIYSITLVVTILAMVGSEMIDAIRGKSEVEHFEQKATWGIVACALIVLQAPAAGALLNLSGASQQTQQVSMSNLYSDLPELKVAVKITPTNIEQSTIMADNYSQVLQAENGIEYSALAELKITGTAAPTSTKSSKIVPRQAPQYLLWFLSMYVALQLFCLYRIPLMQDDSAKKRNAKVKELSEEAEEKETTAFAENLG